MSDKLYYSEKNNKSFIKAEGHITASLCQDLRQKIFDKLSSGSISEINVDLSDCNYMDSTFMGILVGFNRRLEKANGNKVAIYGAGKECLSLLESMEMIKVLKIMPLEQKIEANIQYTELGKNQDIDPNLLLKSHENLMELSESNKQKFSTLHDILQSQINASKNN